MHATNRMWPICAAAFLSVVAGAQAAKVIRGVKLGEAIPAFSVTTPDGASMTDADYAGKPLLLLFVRPDHEASVTALRTAQRLLEQRTDSPLKVLAVSTKPGADEYFEGVRAANAITFPVGQDAARKMHNDFGVMVTPTTLLIGPGGQLHHAVPHVPPNYGYKVQTHADLLLGRISPAAHNARLAWIKRAGYGERESFTKRLALARALVDNKQYELAASILEELAAGQEDAAAVGALLGTAYLELGYLDKAAAQLGPLAEYEPAPLALTVALAHLDFHRQDFGKTESRLLAALRTAPRKSAILYALGRLCESRKGFAEALGYYRRALEGLF